FFARGEHPHEIIVHLSFDGFGSPAAFAQLAEVSRFDGRGHLVVRKNLATKKAPTAARARPGLVPIIAPAASRPSCQSSRHAPTRRRFRPLDAGSASWNDLPRSLFSAHQAGG